MDFGVLGPLEVRTDSGEVMDLGTPKQRALIAALVAHVPHAVSVDALIDIMWGENPPASVLSTLHAYISGLRRVLEPNRGRREQARVLLTQAPGYRLAIERNAVDAERFADVVARVGAALDRSDALADADSATLIADLDTATALWRGEPYADLPDGPHIAAQRNRLVELRVLAGQSRAELLLAQGDHHEAVTALDALIADHPLRENLWGLRATALVRSGRQADALAGLRDLRGLLDAELGIEPSPDIAELTRRILTQDPALLQQRRTESLTGVAAPPPVSQPTPQPTRQGLPTLLWPTVERSAELTTLSDAWDRSVSGATQFVVITGEPGIGKSRIGIEAARLAASGRVAIARCSQDEGAPALWPWRQILDQLGSPGVHGDDAFSLRHHIVDELRSLASTTPLLVVLDDLHWADSSSLRVLTLLADSCETDRLMVVLTWRSAPEPTGALAELSEALGRRHADRLTPAGLTPTGIATMVAAVTRLHPTGYQADLLARRTDGNPFFVSEYARLADQSGDLTKVLTSDDPPTAVGEVIRRRLGRLPDTAAQVLRTAAVIGRDFDLETLAAAVDLSADETLDIIEPLCALGLLREVGVEQYLFFHALVRDVAYAEQPATRRARRHARIAQILDDAAAEPSEIARHWLAAGPAHTAQAWRAAVRAAEVADGLFAHEDSVGYRRAALGILVADPRSEPADRYDVLLDLAESQRQLGDWAAATESVAQAIDVAAAMDDPQRLAQAAVLPSRGATWFSVSHGATTPTTVNGLRTALDRLPAGDSALRVEAMLALATETYYDANESEREGLVEDAQAMADRLGDDALSLQVALRAQLALWTPYGVSRRLVLINRAVELAQRLGDDAGLMQAKVTEAIICGELGRVDAMAAAHRRARALSVQLRQPFPRLVLDAMEATWLAQRGEIDAAWRLVAQVRELVDRFPFEQGTDAIVGAVASVSLWAGTLDGMLDGLAGQAIWRIPNTCSVAVYFTRVGRLDEARAILAERGVVLLPAQWFSSLEWASAAEVALYLDDPALAAQAYELLTPIAGQCAVSGSSTASGPVDAYLAFAAAALGDPQRAARHAGAALELMDEWRIPLVRSWFERVRTEFGF
ncbi:AAA family ATPase [Gordonia sp. TBRC 11910]|uniref:AAA family ATPase n=1 Tax=Gordonia asplenii TaxID=2725283 RepID=A0A848KTP6_9ACTN|nr:BTAD domain-containing putative transcriptional regulator [Gordonia asplenii]NMO01549.1 AAA family ATPase [Gordonia asplenii]